ncbi:hypothetical protein [Oceanospirillum sediminis]|uniref:Uncharacterized protein n=1 Tax=Oceanospirillum sediminis TaxID=2760088 RepID=A0A839ISL8_9GAMM|nr:hypothetical protein [Oceanospirillum sediminis]MBB1487562.1 hypothetical protein [Oceanospirillum sediminis]
MRISSPSQLFKSSQYKAVNSTGTKMETPEATPRMPGNTAETVAISQEAYKKAKEHK